MPTKISCSVRVYSRTRGISFSPTVLPMITDAAEAAPTAVTFSSRNTVLEMDWAAMALSFMWPRMMVCMALATPHRSAAPSTGIATRMKSRSRERFTRSRSFRRSPSLSSRSTKASTIMNSTMRAVSVPTAAPLAPIYGAPRLPTISR